MTDEKELKETSKSRTTLETNLQYSLIIALCFLWTSTVYLFWMYHLLDFTDASSVDWLTEVIGYIFQAIDILCFSLVLKHKKDLFAKKSVFILCIGIDFIFSILSTWVNNFICILVFGYLINFFHGIIAGFYLSLLASQIEPKHRPLVFGGAYGVSSIASWILSLIESANFIRSGYALIAYGILICITIGMVITKNDIHSPETVSNTKENISNGTIALTGITVLLLSLTRGIGLMFGRIGDAAGNLTGIILNDQKILLVLTSSICFVITFVLFFILYNRLYMPVPQPLPTLEERLTTFIHTYEISSREGEVLRLIAAGSSNRDISEKLFISENTVKFHIRNILKKQVVQIEQSYLLF
ncbi:MAG: LuxR C-terminal-related transcriptional regulator [Lachnospira sp.]